MQKIDISTLTKTDRKIIYSIGCLTLQLKQKGTKTAHATIANYCNCSVKTVQRTIKKLEAADLVSRKKPTWKRSAWFMNISEDFYEQIKVVWREQKKLSTQEQNVHSGITIGINNINSLKKDLNSKKTNTEIKKENVTFFISEEILGIDLKNLDNEIGLTHLDLELLFRKIGWRAKDLQASINNYKIALDTGTFCPRIPARAAFIGILSGNEKNPPKQFALIKQETEPRNKVEKAETEVEAQEVETLESKEIQAEKENYWLSLSLEKKNEYLKITKSLNEAISLANNRKVLDQQNFSFSSFFNVEIEELIIPKKKPTFVLGNNEGFVGSLKSEKCIVSCSSDMHFRIDL